MFFCIFDTTQHYESVNKVKTQPLDMLSLLDACDRNLEINYIRFKKTRNLGSFQAFHLNRQAASSEILMSVFLF